MKPLALLVASIAWAENASLQFTFTFTESSPTKGTSTRNYETLGSLNEFTRINAGERVPVRVADDKIQFTDIGTNIHCKVRDAQNNTLSLDCSFERSVIAPGQPLTSQTPRIRTTRTAGIYTVKPGATTQIARFDDPVTGSQIQIDALINRIP